MDRGGGAPHPLSCFPPPQRPITRQAPAPGVASRGPATPKRRVFAGEKSEQLGSAAGSGSRVGAPDRRHVRAGPGPRRRRERHPQPGQVRGQASGRSGRRGEQRGGRDASPGRGVGNPAQPALRLCRTSRSGPGRAAGTGARVPRARAACRRPLARPPPALGSGPRALQTPARASGTCRDPGGGRAGCAGGRARRAAGEDVRLRACAPGAPRFNCRARARFRAPLAPRAPLGQWGASGAGRPGAAEPMIEAARVEGRDLARGAPRPVPGVGVGVGSPAWPARAGGRGGSGAVGRGPGSTSWRAGPPRGRGEPRGVPGVAGTGQPVAMATAGRTRRARARGATGARGRRGVGGSLVSGGVLPLRPHLLEFPGT